MDRFTIIGFIAALAICWSPGGLIDRGRQAAAPIQPLTTLTAK